MTDTECEVRVPMKVYRKNVYGKNLYYPRCGVSLCLCDIITRKTLSEKIIVMVKSRGWVVDEVEK